MAKITVVIEVDQTKKEILDELDWFQGIGNKEIIIDSEYLNIPDDGDDSFYAFKLVSIED